MNSVIPGDSSVTKRILRPVWVIASAFLYLYRPRSFAEAFLNFDAGCFPIILMSYLIIFVVIAVSIYVLYKIDMR